MLTPALAYKHRKRLTAFDRSARLASRECAMSEMNYALAAAQAIAGFAGAEKTLAQSTAKLAYAVLHSLDKMVRFHVVDAKGKAVIDHWVPMGEAIDPDLRKALLDGKRGPELLDCVVRELAGASIPLSAYQRGKVVDTLALCLGLIDRFGDEAADKVALSGKGFLQMPRRAAMAEPKDDEAWDAHADDMVTLNPTGTGINAVKFSDAVSFAKRKPARDATDGGQGAAGDKVEVASEWERAVRAKLGNATFRGKPAMDWAAYITDLTAEELCRAAFLLSQADGDIAF